MTIRRHPTDRIKAVQFVVIDDMGIKVNDVCKHRCNEGWMHRLETAVEPLLTPSIRDGASLLLPPAQQRVLVRWMMKTAMVFEFTIKNPPPFYSFSEREDIRTKSAPTTKTRVWTAHHVGQSTSLAFGTFIAWDIVIGDRVIPMRGHSASIAIGQFAFQTLTVRVPDSIPFGRLRFPMKEDWRTRTHLLWPSSDLCSWPPAESIDTEGFFDMVTRFETPPELR